MPARPASGCSTTAGRGAPLPAGERIELAKEQVIHHFDDNGPHPLDGVEVVIAASAGDGFIRHMAKRGAQVLLTGETDPAAALAPGAGRRGAARHPLRPEPDPVQAEGPAHLPPLAVPPARRHRRKPAMVHPAAPAATPDSTLLSTAADANCVLGDADLTRLLGDDAPHGDLTTAALGIGQKPGRLSCRARQPMTLCGCRGGGPPADPGRLRGTPPGGQRRRPGRRRPHPGSRRQCRRPAPALEKRPGAAGMEQRPGQRRHRTGGRGGAPAGGLHAQDAAGQQSPGGEGHALRRCRHAPPGPFRVPPALRRAPPLSRRAPRRHRGPAP